MTDLTDGNGSYHHGDLRAALIAEGLRLLDGQGGGELSLRAAARNVGVSATAVYRHFPDKDALLAALAEEGFRRLGEAQRAAFDAAPAGGGTAFCATGAAYVRFALKNPALFRLMFSGPAMASRQSDAATFLRANATALAPAGVDPKVFALRAWSVAHGLAMLMLDGLAPADDAMIDRVIASQLQARD
ncbi:MAG TPA: TetR/AcrR family transcriptional regulator [Rhodoblastus sp.]|nr:TetR/AcrR family transcriptional regulator [Rhodoblastus sp.]